VKVRLLCGGKHGISDWDIYDTFSSLRVMERFGVKVRRQKHLKLHAKLLLVDGAYAQTGSMNIDRSAFDLRRELGIESDAPEVVARLQETFVADWEAASKYSAPDPLDPSLHEAVLREPSEAHAEDVVIEELQRGYHLNGRVLRHALVKVSMGPGSGAVPAGPQAAENGQAEEQDG
jgi:hypothetical protein